MRLFAAILEQVWSSKKPKKRTTLTGIEISEKKKHKSDHEYTTDVITFNKEGVVHKKHPFKSREFDGAFKECGCLPDCGCKETKDVKH